ncbi:MAG: AMP-binding protein, partial [Bacteroidales bacterium]|nr:AMP-binding protein [Bacteroidales bacterium]
EETDTVAAIIRRTGAKFMFATEDAWNRCISDSELCSSLDVLSMDSLSVLSDCSGRLTGAVSGLKAAFAKMYPSFKPEDINYHHIESDETAILCYTADEKGLLKEDSFTVNKLTKAVQSISDKHYRKRGAKSLSLLPLSDVSVSVFDMMAPLAAGCHITLLGEKPTPHMIRKALKRVRPDYICTKPVFMERFVRKRIFPKLKSKFVQACLRTPGLNTLVYNKIRRRMMFAFGGKVKDVKVKGRELAPEVSEILMKVKFPFNFSVI